MIGLVGLYSLFAIFWLAYNYSLLLDARSGIWAGPPFRKELSRRIVGFLLWPRWVVPLAAREIRKIVEDARSS